jgi:hypothetical protein
LPGAALAAAGGSPPEPRSQPTTHAIMNPAIHARGCGDVVVNIVQRAYTTEQCPRLAASKTQASSASNHP